MVSVRRRRIRTTAPALVLAFAAAVVSAPAASADTNTLYPYITASGTMTRACQTNLSADPSTVTASFVQTFPTSQTVTVYLQARDGKPSSAPWTFTTGENGIPGVGDKTPFSHTFTISATGEPLVRTGAGGVWNFNAYDTDTTPHEEFSFLQQADDPPNCKPGGSFIPGLHRIAGTDRIDTSINVSEYQFYGGLGAVVLARADDYPDALVGAALAHAKHGPLLLTQGATLPDATLHQIEWVDRLVPDRTVYILGGTNAVPQAVSDELTGLGFAVVRYAGTDRFDTATQVADALGDPTTVLLATGTNFPDALSAGVAAAKVGGVVLLTQGSTLPPETAAYLAAHATTTYAVGGPAAAADPAAHALVGADRYATSVLVANTFFTKPTVVGVATGAGFPDALSGGALVANGGGPLILAAATSLPASTSTYLSGVKGTVANAYLFGGTSALSTAVDTAVGIALGKTPGT